MNTYIWKVKTAEGGYPAGKEFRVSAGCFDAAVESAKEVMKGVGYLDHALVFVKREGSIQ